MPIDDIPQNHYIVDVLLNCATGSTPPKVDKKGQIPPSTSTIRPCLPEEKGEAIVCPVLLSTVDKVSLLRVHMPKDLRPPISRETAWKSVKEIQKRFDGNVPLLDAQSHMGVDSDRFKELVQVRSCSAAATIQLTNNPLQRIKILEERLNAHPLNGDPALPDMYDVYARKQEQLDKVKAIRRRIQATVEVIQLDELKSRKRILRRLGFTSSSDVVEMKGRVACEISTGDELLLTEMIFNGLFNPLSPEQCAALLSCFVFQEKVSQTSAVNDVH